MDSVSEAILEVSREIFCTFCGLFHLLNNAMYRRDFGRFSRQANKYLLFFRFTDFLRSSRYFSSIVISINFYHVDCGDGRQPRILIEFRGPKHVSFPLPGFSQSRVITFFRISTSLCLFSFQGQNNFISLMDIHVQHLASLAEFAGMKLKIISAR